MNYSTWSAYNRAWHLIIITLRAKHPWLQFHYCFIDGASKCLNSILRLKTEFENHTAKSLERES